jgi:hypothetical protein
LDLACLSGKQEIALFLVSRGATFDMFSKNGMAVMDKASMPKSFWEKLLGKDVPIMFQDVKKSTKEEEEIVPVV